MTATKHVVADDTLGQISRKFWEIQRRILEGSLDSAKTIFNLQMIIEDKDVITTSLGNAPQDEAGFKNWWTNFYQKYFNLKVDLSAVKIPDYQEGFDWVIIISTGLTINQVLKALKRQMKVWLYKDDLSDKDIPKNDRDAKNGSYAVRFRKRVEADEELKNYSANDLQDSHTAGITLLERLIMELAYFEESNGQHLDIENWTLCSGSRGSDGNVPGVCWRSGGGLRVNWADLGDARDYLRSRAVVSC